MLKLKQKRDKIAKFDFRRAQVEILKQNATRLADIQSEQLISGVNSKGLRIAPAYAPLTIEYKFNFGGTGPGSITDRVTFFMTGELHRLLRVEINNVKIGITADTFKFQKAIDRSGPETFGFNRESVRDIRSFLKPDVLTDFVRSIATP